MDRLAGGFFIGLLLFIQDLVALVPEFFRDDRLDRGDDPVFLVLHDPFFLISQTLGVVGPMQSLGRGVPEQPADGGIGKLCPIPGPVTGLVEEPGHRLFALMF